MCPAAVSGGVGRRHLIVVSNRGPVAFDRDGAGRRRRRQASGGLVAALRPLVRRHDVTWIANAMSDEERVVAAAGPVVEWVDGERCRLRLVEHDAAAYRSFYDVVANPALWFLQHGLWQLLHDPVDLTAPWRDGYVTVNESLAEVVLEELQRTPAAAVLFQDYHLYVAPTLVRARRPETRIAHFVHIPWVGAEAWAALPPAISRAVHEGLLACDSVGFQSARWRSAFIASSAAILGRGEHATAVAHVNPVAVDAEALRAFASGDEVRKREASLLAERPERLIVRVDRVDPAKNAALGFAAFGRLLARRPDLLERVAMLALLAPSRERIPEYAAYRDAIETEAAAVNAAYATATWTPVVVSVRDDFAGSVAAYRQYDVLLVNSVMDGLNLVAKEAPLVNLRDGALVLSRTTGAWEELCAWALGVDPLDVDGTVLALERALDLGEPERRERLAGIRRHVLERTPVRWVNGELAALDARSTMRP